MPALNRKFVNIIEKGNSEMGERTFAYYTAMIFAGIAATLIIQFSIRSSGTLSQREKNVFYTLFLCIALSAFCEWLGVCLQGAGKETRVVHIAVKAIEFSISPLISIFMARVLSEKTHKAVFVLVGIHAVIELLSGVFGFIYSVDANSVYTHARFYWIYVVSYLSAFFYGIIMIVLNVHKYQYSGIVFFFAIIAYMSCGLTVQLVNSWLRVDYLALIFSALMLYIFALEIIQQTDNLTGLINRRGYENYIRHIDKPCVIVFFDINDFKSVNDNHGHTVGDECIREIGLIIKSVYFKYGKCFRFGGDEFCVIAEEKQRVFNIEELNAKFARILKNQKESDPRCPSVAVGYAFFDPQQCSIIEKIEEADKMMYENKKECKTAENFISREHDFSGE